MGWSLGPACTEVSRVLDPITAQALEWQRWLLATRPRLDMLLAAGSIRPVDWRAINQFAKDYSERKQDIAA